MLKPTYKTFVSNLNDPRFNLALEEYFMSSVKEGEIIVLFWQSEHAVVIGRNQNPYQECNISSLREDDVVLVKRLSGGGAVYHDLGNLNFAFIARSASYDLKHNFEIVLQALKSLGIEGEFNGRNDLIAAGRKFSGNAFIHDDDRALHHGTILVDADVDKIKKYLSVSHEKLDNKGFDSVESRVINLNEINPSLTVQMIINQVVDVIKEKSSEPVLLEVLDKDSFMLRQYLDKYMSHKWNYGDCPEFEMNAEKRFEWGMIAIHLTIDDGRIKQAEIFTDALDSEGFSSLRNRLKGKDLTLESLDLILEGCHLESTIKTDLHSFFMENLFK